MSKNTLQNKRILVTGGAGSIGTELVRQLAPKNKVFILDSNESAAYALREEIKAKGIWIHSRTGDVRNKETIADVFSDFKPEVIFHAAALKHVTPNEEYPEEAKLTNIDGTMNLIKEAKRWECVEKFVFISTDKAVNPTSVMGATKQFCEVITRAQGKGFVVVRFGNVLGSRGSVIPIWQKQIDAGEPVTVTDVMAERYMMTIPQAVSLVIEAAIQGQGGEIMIMDMGERINVHGLALDILKKAGRKAEVNVIGLRSGEKLCEELMTSDEKAAAKKVGNFWIIYGK